MSAFQPTNPSSPTSQDSLFVECVEKLIPLAGQRMQAIDLKWWDVDRFLGLAFHILLTEEELTARQQVAQLLPKFGAKAVPTLFVIYQHQNSDSTLRHLSSQALTTLDRSILVTGLIDTLKASEDDRFDHQISQMLATVAPEAIAALTDLIETQEWRNLALRTLHLMQLPQTYLLLDQLICHPNPDIRHATIDVLSGLKDYQLLCRLENAYRAGSAHPAHHLSQQTPFSPGSQRSSQRDSKDFRLLMKQAAVQTEKQDYWGAIHSYSQVISLNPENANAYGNRGLLKLNVGDQEGAITDFQHAAQLFWHTGKTANFEMTLNYLRKLTPNLECIFPSK